MTRTQSVLTMAVSFVAVLASTEPSRAGTTADCSGCPRMVAIPAGSFVMGSPPTEAGRYKNEGPQQRLTIGAFAMGETEVTRGQFADFVRATDRKMLEGCFTQGDGADDISDWVVSASWRNPDFPQTDSHPVVCVTWQDARDYAAWLSGRTGQRYRLPSEAEWEYAARAGTTTPFFWGESGDRDCTHMNGGDRSLERAFPAWSNAIQASRQKGEAGARLVECDDGSPFTAPVGRYEPNSWGLRDMTGNVWEWVEDCRADALPTDGHAQITSPCKEHRTRGGSWDDYPDDLRSAVRKRLAPDQRRNDVGFRLVREVAREERHD